MTQDAPTVIVVDDDLSMQQALADLMCSVGLRVVCYGSVQEFMKVDHEDGDKCLVLDVRLPGQSGLDLQDYLTRKGMHIPIVFITGHADVPMTVRAMKAGAVEFLEKPFREQELLDAIQLAFSQYRAHMDTEEIMKELTNRFSTLSAREREILPLVAAGRLSKQIAAILGVSEITVKVHRGQVMRKMGAKTLADLVRISDRLNLQAPKY